MSDESKETSKASLVNINLPDSLDNAVTNLTDKPTQSIGQTISDLWQLVLGGRVALAAEKQKLKYAQDLEEYKKSLDAKVSAIPEEKQTVPPMQIAAQTLEDSQYCIESETLREMFSSLIANSMNIDYSRAIHPSFSKIIQQMSPLDAQMLKIFHRYEKRGGIAIAHFIRRGTQVGFSVLIENIPEFVPAGCTQENAARSIVSLQRLGLISIPEDSHFTDDKRYDKFLTSPLYLQLLSKAKQYGYKLDIQRHIAMLTILGRDFVNVCLD